MTSSRSHVQTAGELEKQRQAGLLGAARSTGSRAQHGGFQFSSVTNRRLNAERRGAEGKHHRLMWESTLLKIMLSDFQALYN